MLIQDDTKCVVEVKRVRLYTIDGIDTKNETIDQKLENAVSNRIKDLEMFKEYSIKHDTEENNYWADRYENEQHFKFEIMTYADYQKTLREKYLSMPLHESSHEEFWEMLEVLPPMKWCTIDGVEMFCMREFMEAEFTTQYAHDKKSDKYYSKMVDAFDKSTWIHSLI